MNTSDIEYNMEYSPRADLKAGFYIGEDKYTLTAMETTLYGITLKGEHYQEFSTYEIEFELNTGGFDVSGSGNAFKVFSTVIKILKDEFLDKKKPETFYLLAKEQSRRKLYYHFANNI